MQKISIVIPVLNEEGSLVELHSQIRAVTDADPHEFEICLSMTAQRTTAGR